MDVSEIYQNKSYLNYPCMRKTLEDVIQNPSKKVVIPDNFLEKNIKKTWLISLIQRIQIACKKALLNIGLFFSGSHKTKFKNAVKKIAKRYEYEKNVEEFQNRKIKQRIEELEKIKQMGVCHKIRKQMEIEIKKKQLEENTRQIIEVNKELSNIDPKSYLSSLNSEVQACNMIIEKVQSYKEKSKKKIELEKRYHGIYFNLCKKKKLKCELEKLEAELSIINNEIIEFDPPFKSTQIDDEILRYEQILKTFKDLRDKRKKQLEEKKEALTNVINKLSNEMDGYEKPVETVKDETVTEGLRNKKPASKKLTSYQKMVTDIEKNVNTDIKNLWEALFKKCKNEDIVESWDCKADGNFTLKCKKTIKVWTPSLNEKGEEDPIGGIVLMIGPVVQGVLLKEGIKFEKGFRTFCKYKIPLPFFGYREIEPYVTELSYKNRNKIIFTAGLKFAGHVFTKGREKTYEYLMNNWENNGINLTDQDHKQFIRDTFQKSKK